MSRVGFILNFDVKEAQKNARELDKEIKNLGNDIVDAFKTSSVIAWGLAIKEVTTQMISASKAESDYIERTNLMKVAYHEATKEGKALADNADTLLKKLKNFYGLDPNELTKSLGIFKQMSNAMGLANDTSALLSENLVKMSEDVSSLYNLDVEVVAKKFQSALAGQTRAVRDLGVDVTKSALQQELYNRGINLSIDDLNRASKSVLIYLTMQRQLAEANGDASRTINGVANQTRIFKEQIAIASRQIGALFIPVLKTILPLLNGILMAMNAIGELILRLFGIDPIKLASEFGLASVETGLDDVGASAVNAGKAVDDLRGKLRGFDKLNVITTPKEDKNKGGGGIGGGIGGVDKSLLAQMDEYNKKMFEVANKAKQIRDAILEWLGFTIDENGEINGFKLTLGSIIGGSLGLMVALKTVKGIWNFAKTIGKAIGLLPKDTDKWVYNTKGLLSPLRNIIGYYSKFRKEGKGIFESAELARQSWAKSANVIESLKLGAIGIATAFAGIKIFGTSLENIDKEGRNIKNTIGEIAGAILVVVGAIETTTAVVKLLDIAFKTTWATNPITLLIGALIGAGGLIASLIMVKDKADETTKSISLLSEEEQKDIISHENQMRSAQELSTELENLIDANGRVKKGYEDRVNYILKELSEAYGTEFELVDGQIYVNGKLIQSYKDIQDEIDTYMKKLNAQYLLEKLKDKYNDALDKHYEKQNKINAVEQTYTEKLEDLKKQLDNNSISMDDYNGKVDALKRELQNMIGQITGEYEESSKFFYKYTQLNKAYAEGNMQQIEEYYDSIMQDQITSVSDYADTYRKTFENALKVSVHEKEDYIQNLTGTDKEFYKAGKEMGNSFKDGFQVTTDGKIKFKVQQTENGGYVDIKMRASGGFVDSGELYMARENGMSEMIGRIGNKTAVANNDQIINGIAIGVAKAMSSVKNNQTINIVAEDGGILDYINFKQKQKDRQYGF